MTEYVVINELHDLFGMELPATLVDCVVLIDYFGLCSSHLVTILHLILLEKHRNNSQVW